jgi:inorganic pyrophosphatase
MENSAYWQALDQLVQHHEMVVDRPRGSRHPRYPDFIYPYDYGYLKGTHAMDQDGMDIWVGSQKNQQVTGVICTVDLVKSDAELKLLIGCTAEEAAEILKTHNNGQQSAILLLRPGL